MRRRGVAYLFIGILGIAGALYFCTLSNHTNLGTGNTEKELQYDNEEKPKEVISEEEKAVNQRRLKRMQQRAKGLKSASGVSSYANGKITGTWEQFRFRTYPGSPYGFRTKGSVYDQKNDVLYALMEKGHMWKIHRDPSDQIKTTWEIMNHHENFVSSYIDGITTSEGSFRMVRSGDNGMAKGGTSSGQKPGRCNN